MVVVVLVLVGFCVGGGGWRDWVDEEGGGGRRGPASPARVRVSPVCVCVWAGGSTAFAMSYFEQQSSERAISRPHLVWVVQNFHLQMRAASGEELTGEAWITSILDQAPAARTRHT